PLPTIDQSKPRDSVTPAATTTPRVTTTTATTAAPGSTSTGAPSDGAVPLSHVSLFATLDTESLRELASAMRRRIFRGGEVIFHRDDPGQVLYIIREGKVKIYNTSPE